MIEARRKERLKKELSQNIQQLKNKLQMGTENVEASISKSSLNLSVFKTDQLMQESNLNFQVRSSTNVAHTETDHKAYDLSDLIYSSYQILTPLEQELNDWIRRIDERILLTDKDKLDQQRLYAECSNILKNSSLDIEDKIQSVSMRVLSYLEGAPRLNETELDQTRSNEYEYQALCELLHLEPIEMIPSQIEHEIKRLTSILEKEYEDRFIMEMIQTTMEELGCQFDSKVMLDHTLGQLYSLSEHPLCNVFVGNDGTGILFEPVGLANDGSLNQRREIESSANKICSMYSKLEERLAEKGIFLNQIYIEPAKIEKMFVQSDLSTQELSKAKIQKRTSSLKQKQFDQEG